jgi:hypothetical protein
MRIPIIDHRDKRLQNLKIQASGSQMNIPGRPAAPLHIVDWVDPEGRRRSPLHLADLGTGYKVLFCFQHACPGCHLQGFPTLRTLIDELDHGRFGFAAIQTVFEDFEVNTYDKLILNQSHYGLAIPFGHDPASAREALPSIVKDYHTKGTSWFIVIDPDGSIFHSDFTISLDSLRRI